MSRLNENYKLSTDEYGLAIIEITGRCTSGEASTIEGNCTRRYKMVPMPNASGAVLKSMDGSVPIVVTVTPSTMPGRNYRCVKVDGRVNPFAPQQEGGEASGSTVLFFMEKYQEVGGVA